MASLRYAVFGHPVAHSRSPRIHAAFAAQAGIELTYERIDAAPADFADRLAAFAREGGRGANVTLPHKQAAAALCATVSARAARAGAVNTLVRPDEGDAGPRWHGDNTDGIGLVRDLRDRHRVVLAGARVLLLGAGGAGAGVAPALLDAGASRLVVVNRGIERAHALARHLGDARVVVCALDATQDATEDGLDASRPVHARVHPDGDRKRGSVAQADACGQPRDHAAHDTRAMHVANVGEEPIDLVINATSAARGGAAPWQALGGVIARAQAAVDLGYGEAAGPFLEFARSCGTARRIDGLGMLVEQAAESFRLWHGVTPDTAPVLAALRDDLGAPP